MQEWTNVAAAVRLAGWVVYPLTVLAVLAVAIALDRAYVFLRFGRLPAAMRAAHEIDAPGAREKWADRLQRAPSQNAFRRMSAPWEPDRVLPLWLREAKAESVASQIERDMSKGFWVLETIVTAAPLLGLLGTIIGLIHGFAAVSDVNPAQKQDQLSAAVSIAMNCTAFGLMVAIPFLLVHAWLVTMTDELVDSLEMASVKFLNSLGLKKV